MSTQTNALVPVDVLAGLSDAMKRALSNWKFRYRPVDNPTMQALRKRGIVQWASPGWGDPHGRWITTAKGDAVRAALARVGDDK